MVSTWWTEKWSWSLKAEFEITNKVRKSKIKKIHPAAILYEAAIRKAEVIIERVREREKKEQSIIYIRTYWILDQSARERNSRS